MRKLIITTVWLLGIAALIAPYFVGQWANDNIFNLTASGTIYFWTLEFIIVSCVTVGAACLALIWPIAEDIADWAERKLK